MANRNSTSYVILTNVNTINTSQYITDQEKIEIYDKCRNRTYHNEKLKPILEDIFNMFDFEFKHHLGFNFDNDDKRKIQCISNILQPLYDVIDTNNVPLFHKLVWEVTHPNNNTISFSLIFDMMNLLLHSQKYCNLNDHYFTMITDYFINEEKYDFYLENSNYPYFNYLSKLFSYAKENNIKYSGQGIEALIIYYFLKNNIESNKFIEALNYVHNNIQYLNSFHQHNYKREHNDDFNNIVMDLILNQLNNKRIK